MSTEDIVKHLRRIFEAQILAQRTVMGMGSVDHTLLAKTLGQMKLDQQAIVKAIGIIERSK